MVVLNKRCLVTSSERKRAHSVPEGEIVFRLSREQIEGIPARGLVPELSVLRLKPETGRVAEPWFREVQMNESGSGNEVSVLIETWNIIRRVNESCGWWVG